MTGVEGTFIRVDAMVEVDGDEDDLQAIEMSQDAVAVPASLKQRFFDADWVGAARRLARARSARPPPKPPPSSSGAASTCPPAAAAAARSASNSPDFRRFPRV